MTLVTSVSGPTPWKRIRQTVLGSATKAVDIVSLSQLKSAKYFVSISNETNNRYRRFELNVTNDNSVLRDSVFGRLSSGSMNIEVSMKVNGVNAELEIINNETFDLDVELIRGVLNV